MDLRVRVFCDEQGVSREEELDGLDDEALQILALDESGVIATCRLRDLGAEWKLERMAVEARVRGLGVGARLLAGAEDEARTAAPSRWFCTRRSARSPSTRRTGTRRRARCSWTPGSSTSRCGRRFDGRARAPGARDPPRSAHRAAHDPLAGARRPPLRLRWGDDR